METENKRGFTGLWIPAEIVNDKRLSYLEWLVYAKVSDYTGEYCDSSNGQLALFFGVSERSISKAVNTLISSGYIALKGFDGRKRLLTRTNNFLSRN